MQTYFWPNGWTQESLASVWSFCVLNDTFVWNRLIKLKLGYCKTNQVSTYYNSIQDINSLQKLPESYIIVYSVKLSQRKVKPNRWIFWHWDVPVYHDLKVIGVQSHSFIFSFIMRFLPWWDVFFCVSRCLTNSPI